MNHPSQSREGYQNLVCPGKIIFKSLKAWMRLILWWVTLKSLKTWMSHFQVSRDLDESFSRLSRLGWVIFKSRKTLMRSGKKRNRKPKFQGDWGDLCRGQGGKRDKKGQKKIQFFLPHVRYVRWIDRTTARAAHVRSRAAFLIRIPCALRRFPTYVDRSSCQAPPTSFLTLMTIFLLLFTVFLTPCSAFDHLPLDDVKFVFKRREWKMVSARKMVSAKRREWKMVSVIPWITCHVTKLWYQESPFLRFV
jgi:hypothetical protein